MAFVCLLSYMFRFHLAIVPTPTPSLYSDLSLDVRNVHLFFRVKFQSIRLSQTGLFIVRFYCHISPEHTYIKTPKHKPQCDQIHGNRKHTQTVFPHEIINILAKRNFPFHLFSSNYCLNFFSHTTSLHGIN
jgi:hypothetical protein